MSQTSRSRSARSPSVSRPFQQERPVPVPTVSSMANKTSKTHRPSLSGTMNWLGRGSSSSSNSAPYAPSKPIKISEPKMQSAFDVMAQRSGALGSGATVVRTPQEALGVPKQPQPLSFDPDGQGLGIIIPEEDEEFEEGPKSPPLPPLPVDEEERGETVSVKSKSSQILSRPARTPPSVPMAECPSPDKRSQRPALKVLDQFPPVPALPNNIVLSTPQPPFEAILISNGASGAFDRNTLMVILETTTQTYKTTFNTLTSRPSSLASYLESLLPGKQREADEVSVSSQTSEAESNFNSIFHNHLASSGLLPTTATSIHIFLDRPSAPYAHILAYLRAPEPTPEHPAALPRAVQLSTTSSSRLEALLELRDEARYLELEELHKLCTDEIRHRQSASSRNASHSRGMSSVSLSSGSVRSLHTLQESEEVDERRHSRDSGVGSSIASTSSAPRSSIVPEVGWQSTPPPTIPGLSQRKKYSSLKSKPTGAWI